VIHSLQKLALQVVAFALLFGFGAQEVASQTAEVAKGKLVAELSQNIWVVFQDSKDQYWFGSDGQGVFRYDGQSIIQFTAQDGLAGDRVREIKQDADGNILIGTLTGISKYDGVALELLTPIERFGRDGWRLDASDLWFEGDSNTNGPLRYDGKNLYRLRLPPRTSQGIGVRVDQDKKPSEYGIYTIYQDQSGCLWFGTATQGLCRYDGSSFGWMYERELTETPEGGSFGIRSIMEDRDGLFWICNVQQRYAISSKTGDVHFQKESLKDLARTPAGTKPIYYNAIAKDKAHHLWLCTYGDGVWRYDGSKLKNYSVTNNGKNSLGVTVYKDNKDRIWLGTQDSGVFLLENDAFQPFRP
jgi:ligand-binding sensor domain-containing protein